MVRLKVKELLDEKNLSRYQLSKETGIQYQIIDKYYKNKVVRFDSYVIDRICKAIDCDVKDIIEFVKEEN